MEMWQKIIIGIIILWTMWNLDEKFKRLERRIDSLERKCSNDSDFDDE